MITITPATEEQLSTIRSIAYQTWPSTFGAILSPEQIEYMLTMMYSPEALLTQAHEKNHVFLLANESVSQEALGFVSYELDYKGESATKIHKLYLLPDSQGKGVGRQLIDCVSELARRHGNDRLSLNVNRNNKAIQFYERIGFSVVKQENIDIGNGYLMEDFVMEKPLS
ncbi:GNAT family N-acetyltransferase [Spirosoma sp. KUDC1026]|uniref:GNAT family N-acetyltransferase n=1 Tax=Spirosoma sp. KUDC1026 TaxID=2745947 RepID=UPI00159BEFB0|nr:GNAT family N-acetyltransferase [Spirosoma sp. KUDC1026]QKZ13607.1 GNAT family N-acetyltransferase [Spirosoma sp. KUDC1026]